MRILHYFLGFPPYRTGGMTKFAIDLMQEQASDGNNVFALWPGRMNGRELVIKKRKSVGLIENYEIVNPLPVPLDEGINNIAVFMAPCDATVYEQFLKKLELDAIHIHTLMGLHKEFISAACKLKIKTIFTSHDYFGICPKVTLFRFGECCDDDCDCEKCVACNANALSVGKIRLLQSPTYRMLKNTAIVKLMRKRHRDVFFEEKPSKVNTIYGKSSPEEYKKLRAYYVEMIESTDVVHFNSALTKQIYTKYLVPKSNKVIPITHKGIKDCRDNSHVDDEKMRIVYLSPHKAYKGYDILKSALDDIWKSGNHGFELQLFHPVSKSEPYMNVQKNGYIYSDLPDIFANADVLAAPSVCYETFGFTVLEAISFGVPVILSDHVGAKELIENAGIVVKAGSVEEMKKAILQLDKSMLSMYREGARTTKIPLWTDMVGCIYGLYTH